jgi:hypothetical protein
LRRPDGGDDPPDLPIHRWADDHSLDILEGPEPCNWRPETTSWVKDILSWAEQQAQEPSDDSDENLPIELLSFRNRRTDEIEAPHRQLLSARSTA